jgi:hypothetical protein
MTDSEPSEISIKPKVKKMAPLGYKIELTEANAQVLAEFVGSPAYHVLKKVFVRQRRDQIARTALNSAETVERLQYFKGMAAELILLFQVLQDVKKAYAAERTDKADKLYKK